MTSVFGAETSDNSIQTGLNFTVNHTDSINEASKLRHSDLGSAKFGQESEKKHQEYISPSTLSRLQMTDIQQKQNYS